MTAPLARLIDTNVVSETMRPRPKPRVAALLNSIAGEGIGFASVSVREVRDGIGRLEPGWRRRNLDDAYRRVERRTPFSRARYPESVGLAQIAIQLICQFYFRLCSRNIRRRHLLRP